MCVVLPWVLNMNAREQARYIHTELFIVEIAVKLSEIRNPINYAPRMYRMSIRETPDWLKFKRMQEQSYQAQKRMVTLLKRLCLHVVFSKKF